jgi:hypothetical protein
MYYKKNKNEKGQYSLFPFSTHAKTEQEWLVLEMTLIVIIYRKKNYYEHST